MDARVKIDSEFLKDIKEAQKADVKFVDLLIGENQTEDSDFRVEIMECCDSEVEFVFLTMMR